MQQAKNDKTTDGYKDLLNNRLSTITELDMGVCLRKVVLSGNNLWKHEKFIHWSPEKRLQSVCGAFRPLTDRFYSSQSDIDINDILLAGYVRQDVNSLFIFIFNRVRFIKLIKLFVKMHFYGKIDPAN